MFYDIPTKSYKVIPGTEDLVLLDTLRAENKVWGNADTTVVDLGDGILNLEFLPSMCTCKSAPTKKGSESLLNSWLLE